MEKNKNTQGADILKDIPATQVETPVVETPTVAVKTTTVKEEKKPAWLEALENKIAQLEADNAMLKDMQGKNAIKSYEDGQRSDNLKTAHFKKWNDKIVIGWDKLDYSHFNPSAPDGLRENILTTLIFDNGEREQVNYVAFNNSQEVVHLEIISQKNDLTTVKMPDGRELVVESRFLNR